MCYDFYKRCNYPPIGITANVVLSDLELNFKGQTFEMLISLKQ